MTAMRGRADAVRLLWRRLTLVGLFIGVVAAGWAVWGVYEKERESRLVRTQAEFKLKALKEREAELTADIASLESERGKEAALRGAYAVGKEGEGVVIIVDRTPTSTEAATSSPLQWITERLKWW